ncbi:MAG: NAD-dependent protein deacetylase [Candidatus Competibacterales bacterium]
MSSPILPHQGAEPATNAAVVADLVAFVRRYPKLLVITGAGCSTASGIPDYRDSTGDWKRPPPMEYRQFIGSEGARRRYWARSTVGWQTMGRAEPNPAHGALAQLEALGHVALLVTQNVDGLHQRAGSRQVLDLHGRLDQVVCLQCRWRWRREVFQRALEALNPDYRHRRANPAPDGDAYLEEDFSQFQVPPCYHCGGILKPFVVFFGEPVPRHRVERARQRLAEADGLLVVGSSLMVYSGYRFCRAASDQGKPVAAVNLGRTRADGALTLKVEGPCQTVLPALAAGLLQWA